MTRRIFIVLGVLVVAGAVALLAWNTLNSARAARPLYAESDLAPVERGALIATVSATGSLEPATSVSLAFLIGGSLTDVYVKQGDTVRAGQPLAKLDTAELELQLAQAEANLALAQSKLSQTQKGGADSTVAAAQANLNSAYAAYDKLRHPDPNQVTMAKSDLGTAQAALDQAQSAYDRIGGGSNPYIALSPQALQLQNATFAYQKALAAYNAGLTPTNAQLQAALAQIQQAKDTLARLSPTGDDLAQAQANVDAARAGRDLAKQRLAEANIVAPFDGTITQMDLTRGDFIQAGKPVLTLADLAHLQINIDVDETDIPRVTLGQAVALDLDAFPGQQIQGRVADIAPGAATVQGVVNYQVKIEVLASALPVKIGMTSNASIQVARKDNVLLIPTRAIRASGSKRLVTVLENGQPKEVEVTLGLSNDSQTEVLSGLTEGQQVVTAVTPSNAPNLGQGNNNGG